MKNLGKTTDTGLSEVELAKLRNAIFICKKVSEVILYGSRAKGTFKRFSDIDLTLKGEDLTANDIFPILERIDDLDLPFEIDLSIYNLLDNEALIEEINKYGIRLV